MRTPFRLLPALLLLVSCSQPKPDLNTPQGLLEESRSRLSQTEGTITLPGLQQPVEVLRDRWGVAHIYAKTLDDLFFAQGFVAAQDRLYQIEIWRRTGTGELAEVFGLDFVERDRIARLVRYRGDMDAEWQSYSPQTKQIATAFTNGINAYIRQRGDRLPIEFELLDFKPGVWKPEDCLLRIAGLLMTRNARQEVARAEMVAKLGVEATQKFMPTDPPRKLDPDPDVDLKGIDDDVLAGYRAAISIPTLEENQGSNNWVVDGSMTTTGKPLLASDPHRPVILPSLRYLVHLNGPGWNVIGSGEPALPGVAIGHNERIGWGFTIVQYDQVDLYVEKTNPANRNQYEYKGEWLDMTVEHEQVKARGQEKPAEVELKFTRHGPVFWEDPAGNRVVVIRWTGTEPGTAGYLGSLALDEAKSWDDFVAALSRWKIPSENIIYADVEGNIGWTPAGLLPVRDNWSGLFPVPGHTGKYEWSGFRSVDQLPRIYNPQQHYVATANHNIRPANYPHDLAFDWTSPYRISRIKEVLEQGKKFTIDDFKRLQHDETSLPARQLQGMLAKLPAEGGEKFATGRKLIEGWDCVLKQDSAAAALYEVWFRQVEPKLLKNMELGENTNLIGSNLAPQTMLQLLEAQSPKLRGEILRESLEAAMEETAKLQGDNPSGWRWGALHTITFAHPLANSDARKEVFNKGPVGRGGDSYTPNATGGPGFSQGSGASYRHILDLEDWDRSVFTSTPGQSGQPGSPHYDDLLQLWANYEYAPLVFSREAVEQNTAQKLVLAPGTK